MIFSVEVFVMRSIGMNKYRHPGRETISSDKRSIDIFVTCFVFKMSNHRSDIKVSQNCIELKSQMPERQDPDNFP